MKRLLFLAFVVTPFALQAQTKEQLQLQSIQRDVAQVEESVRALQKVLDDKFAQALAAIQASGDSQAKTVAAFTALQREVDKQFADMQTKLTAPVVSLGSKVDEMSADVRALSNTVADLAQRAKATDDKLTDIKNLVSTMAANQSAPAPPSPAVTATQATPAKSSCQSAESLWESARGDYSGARFDIALTEYMDYVKCYGDSANAPEAQYQIGWIYFNNKQFGDAAQAFDVVHDRWPENKKSQDAMYYKAVSLMKADPDNARKAETGKAFKDFIATYPHSGHVEAAHQNLKTLGLEHAAAKKRS
jgi:TolA-binding protein